MQEGNITGCAYSRYPPCGKFFLKLIQLELSVSSWKTSFRTKERPLQSDVKISKPFSLLWLVYIRIVSALVKERGFDPSHRLQVCFVVYFLLELSVLPCNAYLNHRVLISTLAFTKKSYWTGLPECLSCFSILLK